MWLCGVRIPHSAALSGHSDADVGLHALADALYGALADGDIGQHFPPSDPQWKGTASKVFLAHAAERVRARGGAIVHLDATLICEVPKIGPHRDTMRARVAEIAGLDIGRVAVKATTSEGSALPGAAKASPAWRPRPCGCPKRHATSSRFVVNLLKAVDGRRDTLEPRLQLQGQKLRIMPRLVKVAAMEP